MNKPRVLKKLVFPNQFGSDLPSVTEVQELQARYSFSNQYADFLIKQNGFEYWAFYEHPNQQNFISTELVESSVQTHEELRVLFSFSNNSLINHFVRDEYIDYFFPMGTDPAGNIFVEVLQGRYKGYIACINHEAFTQSAPSFIKEIGEHYVNADSRELAALKHYMPSVFDQAGSLKLVENLKAEEILEFFVLYDWDFCSLTSASFNFFIDNIIVTEKDEGHFSLRTVDQSLNGKPLFV